uniref:Uncharacterized protein n=1 Tax=Tanacetum cinerariifolium TaxID=118510 RepID=A0A6L2K0D4_TANCI|nr:hypothetical protein [Tanacetum cinerariifolium]
MDIIGPDYLRKPTVTYVVKLYQHHEEKHGFPGMIVWIGRSLVVRTPLKGNMSNNDINVLHQSLIFNDLKTGQASEIYFVANGVTYPWRYYLVDGIYPELVKLITTIQEPSDDDNKRILYTQKRESARKDVK